MAELGDLDETLWYLGSFWRFVLSSRARKEAVRDWQSRGLAGKALGLLEASIAAIVGLAPIALLIWLLS